jgi:hypothetical protein
MGSGESSQRDKFVKILVITLFILLVQLTATVAQVSRYEVDEYDCSDMSEDCEEFFEELGFSTRLVTGIRDNGTNHQWCLVDVFGIQIEFESTTLMPVSPRWANRYDRFLISDGYVIDGEKVEEATYVEW